MSIYVFSLLVGYRFSGVDSAQGNRNMFLKKTSHSIKYIFTQVPREEFIQQYVETGIDRLDMLSAHLMLADNSDISGNYKVSDKIEEIKQTFGDVEIRENDKSINLYRGNKRFASMILKKNPEYFWRIDFFESERLIESEYYAGQLLYTDYYATATENGRLYAKKLKTSFVNKSGRRVYDCLYSDNGQELYVYTNGMRCTKAQIIVQFVKKLNLTESDIVLIDRPSFFDYVQPLFQTIDKAKIMVFLHSGHYYEKGEEPSAIYLNYEYNYWFKYSNKIDTIIVSTEEQKEDLRNKLIEYNCFVPKVEAILTGGLSELKYARQNRKRYSMLTVGRLDSRKKVNWIIASVIEAHKYNPEIQLDIYGEGAKEYELKNLVASNNAESYIRFMGHCDVSEIYKNYEIYISASLWETLGLSVMEAVGSGNALIGLNVRYGNRLFIEDKKNGRLVDFQVEDSGNQEKVQKMIGEMSNAIVEMFSDSERLQKYHEHSYRIAEQFLNEKIERKWIELFKTI